MPSKVANILDFVHPGLDSRVWDSTGKLFPKQKEFILGNLYKILEKLGLKFPLEWITQFKITGSLTTYQYTFDSDLDIHLAVDLEKFIATTGRSKTLEEASQYLDEIRKTFVKELLPGTQHPIEYYFETSISSLNPEASVYDILEDKWIKDPVTITKDFDINDIKPFVLDAANSIASEMDSSLGEIKRDIRRIEELEDVLRSWSSENQKNFKQKLEQYLLSIEEEIRELNTTKKDLVMKRRVYAPQGDDEIKFKYLQKFGYFYIITELEKILEEHNNTLPEKAVPEVKEVVRQASMPRALMIDFDQTIARNDSEHNITEPMPGVKEALDELKADNWRIIVYSCRADTPEGQKEIKDFMQEHNLPYDEIFVGKPKAEYYIDDRNIQFTSWDDVLKQVQASLVKETKKNYDYSCVMVSMPPKTCEQVLAWSKKNIPDDILYEGTGDEKDNYGREKECHVTVLYGLHTNKKEDVEKFLHLKKPLSITFGKVGFFSNKDKPFDVVMIEILCPELHELNKVLTENLEYTTEHPEYHPHMTLAYVKKGEGDKYKDMAPFAGEEVLVDTAIFSPAEGKKESIDITAAFYPSIIQAPDNKWQTDSDKQTITKPSDTSDEETYFNPIVDKPRKNRWDAFLNLLLHKPQEKKASLGAGWITYNKQVFYLQDSFDDHANMVKRNPERFGFKKAPKTWEDVLEKGNVRFTGAASSNNKKVLLLEAASLEAAKNAEDFIYNHLNDIDAIEIQAHTDYYEASTKDFKERGWEAFSLERNSSLNRKAAPPPPDVMDYRKTKIQPLGFTELMYFRENAPEDVQEEVENLIENDEFQKAWVIVEKYIGRRHMRFGKASEKHNTTWEIDEPSKPLPVTYSPTTNDENLNSYYPWRYMRRPSGPNYSNEDELTKMLLEQKGIPLEVEAGYKEVLPTLIKQYQSKFNTDENTAKNWAKTVKKSLLQTQADTCYTDKDMEEIYLKQHEYEDSIGGGNVYHEFPNSTTDYPKHPGTPKVQLDRLTPPPNNVIPSYEVVWYISSPAEDNGSM